jgi:putative PIN family toxin of toxin-antitoxin system
MQNEPMTKLIDALSARTHFGEIMERAEKQNKFLLQIKKHGKWVKPNVSVEAAADPEDNKFLECALKAKADFVITGNIKHFPSKKFHDTRIVTPSQFLEIVTKILFK